MRIGLRVAELGVDAIDQPIAHRVFHVLRFFVDFVPGEVERLDEELLDQADAAAARGAPAPGRPT